MQVLDSSECNPNLLGYPVSVMHELAIEVVQNVVFQREKRKHLYRLDLPEVLKEFFCGLTKVCGRHFCISRDARPGKLSMPLPVK